MKLLFLLSFFALVLVACERKTVVIETPEIDPVASNEEIVAETPAPGSGSSGSSTRTLETMRLNAALDAFERNASAENNADVKKAFADLEGEIAELEGQIARVDGEQRQQAAAKLQDLRKYRDGQKARYTMAQDGLAAGKVAPNAGEAVDRRTGAEKAVDTAVRAGREIEDGAKKVGDVIEDVVKDVAR